MTGHAETCCHVESRLSVEDSLDTVRLLVSHTVVKEQFQFRSSAGVAIHQSENLEYARNSGADSHRRPDVNLHTCLPKDQESATRGLHTARQN